MEGGSWHYPGSSDQDHPQEKEMGKSKMALWGGLTNSYEKKWSAKKKKRRKGKIYPFECRVPKNSKERFKKKKTLPQWPMQRNREKQQNGKD